jgi:hypothetical protein
VGGNGRPRAQAGARRRAGEATGWMSCAGGHVEVSLGSVEPATVWYSSARTGVRDEQRQPKCSKVMKMR